MNNFKIAMHMLGEAIDFYTDDGDEINKAYYNGDEEELIDTYNRALEAIQKRYDVAMEFYKKDSK